MTKDYNWIEHATHDEIAKVKEDFKDAAELAKDAEIEFEEELKIKEDIEMMINELFQFEEDIDEIIDNKKLEMHQDNSRKLTDMHKMILEAEENIKDVKERIKDFKEIEEKDIKKSTILEKKVTKVEHFLKHLKKILKLED